MAADPITVRYPRVIDEFETVKKMRKGFNIARYGDGELKMIYGCGYVRQVGSIKLATELHETLIEPHGQCIIGIPNMDPRSPKIENWLARQARFAQVVNVDMKYYSSFITRPDSAPWIATREYVKELQEIWRGKRVVVLCERKGSMFRAVRLAAKSTIHVECPYRQAYDVIDDMEKRILEHPSDVVILSCGPSATCLANRLARRGVFALDLGSAGQFIARTMQ